jgi:hypothetical protein
VTFDSDVYVERMEYLNGRIYVKNHTLTVDEIWNINNGGGAFFNGDVANSSIIQVNNVGIVANILVFTDGNASDGGLRLKINGNTTVESASTRIDNTSPITFPIGFTPDGGTTFFSRHAQLKVKDFADDGYIRINVVSGQLQTTDLAGGELLEHYWRVRHDGFTTVPKVAFRFYIEVLTMEILLICQPVAPRKQTMYPDTYWTIHRFPGIMNPTRYRISRIS